ncbi:MAG: S1/P1 Nuclease [Vicinamibacteria bacterium]
MSVLSSPDRFERRINFHALSLKDLLEAREAYHVHLSHLSNVVATAVGRYRIRRDDLEADPSYASSGGTGGSTKIPAGAAPVRTLANSVVTADSWPALLVFVRRWRGIDSFVRGKVPEQIIPKRLYMPDGRAVPVCVILAPLDEGSAGPIEDLNFASDLIGGGFPAFTDAQGEQRVGSIGCLVTNGASVFALTNRHVTGEPHRLVHSVIRGQKVTLGQSSPLQATRVPFETAYPGWPISRAYSTVDAGTIDIDDLGAWTAQVFGVGEIGEPIDLSTDNLSLELIGTPVRGFGAASGAFAGEIQALFYRYKSVGGFDYVADFLVGPREGAPPVSTRPGDSGTLLFYDPPPVTDALEEERKTEVADDPDASRPEEGRGLRAQRLRPIALQWGGHRLLGDEGGVPLQFALATSLSTVCRLLDVELVRDWNIGHSEYWGKVGHYTVAAKACALATGLCGQLFQANLTNISFADAKINKGDLDRVSSDGFVPLADVADLVWRTKRPKDRNNHFADLDQPGALEFDGRTLLDLCAESIDNIDVAVWNRFYASIGAASRGALPFRVWQMYDAMVEAIRGGDVNRYLCAAGLLAHYVGDACQPLHVSELHHGESAADKNVHSDYETRMLDRFAVQLLGFVNGTLATLSAKRDLQGGREAAAHVIQLMRATVAELSPQEVVDVWRDTKGRTHIAQMWEALGQRTASCIARGARVLADLWESAWTEGGGDALAPAKIRRLDRRTLERLYMDRDFLLAMTLQEMEASDLFD